MFVAKASVSEALVCNWNISSLSMQRWRSSIFICDHEDCILTLRERAF